MGGDSGGESRKNKTFFSIMKLCKLFREKKRKTYDSIVNFGALHAVILVATGFVGGIFTAIAGSGDDICSFSILSLLFR